MSASRVPLIVSMIILMVAIPPLLGAPPFYLQGPPNPNAEKWLEFARTFLATLTGAGVAFLANLYLQDRARRLQQIASGSHAMTILIRQYNGYKNLQISVTEEIKIRDQFAPGVPLWFTFRPVLHQLSNDLAFDFESLMFLFEDGNLDLLQELIVVEALYRDLLGQVEQLNEDSSAKQERFEKAAVGERGNLTPEQANEIVGPRLRFRLEGVIDSIQRKCKDDGAKYLQASSDIHRALVLRFSGQSFMRIVE